MMKDLKERLEGMFTSLPIDLGGKEGDVTVSCTDVKGEVRI